jgi:tetratricopeptide (TPR) repeat protein
MATLAVALFVGFGTTLPAQAQSHRNANPNAPKLVVVIFKSSDKQLGPEAAEAVRSRIEGDVSYRSLWVVPKNDINVTLEASGYSTTDALSSSDANLLSKQLRGDEYLEGVVTKTGASYTIEAWLVLTRDAQLVQPLGTFDGPKLDAVADKVSRAYQDAHNKTFDSEKKCRSDDREGKTADAQKEIESTIKAYPRTTWLRYCALMMAKSAKKPAAEILKIVEEIRAIDPKSKMALKEAVTLYDELGKDDEKDAKGYRTKKIEVLMALREADPTNSALIAQIGAELAASGKMDVALPMVEKSVNDNPGDINLVKLYFAILGATKNTKKMAAVGEEMVKMDTSAADQGFFDKMMSAYAADSNYAKALEWQAKATQKFPNVAANWLTRSQLEKKLGQAGPSMVSLRRAYQVDPKAVENAHATFADAYLAAGQIDSAVAEVRASQKAGEDKLMTGGTAVKIGQTLQKAADASKSPDDWARAYAVLAYADSIAPPAVRPQAKFLLGYAAFQLATPLIVENQTKKSCEQAKRAAGYLLEAQINLPAGGSFAPEPTKQLLGAVAQYLPASDSHVKAFCK